MPFPQRAPQKADSEDSDYEDVHESRE